MVSSGNYRHMKARIDRRRKHKNLNLWEHPKGSGITIEEIINRTNGKDFGGAYRVCIPKKVSGTKRFYRQFKSKKDAFKFAEGENKGKQESGSRYFALTTAQREEALQSFGLLKGTGITLIDATGYAIKHLKPKGGDITINSLLIEFFDEKKTLKLRPRSIEDLKMRLGTFANTFGKCQVKDISQKAIETWLKGMDRLSTQSIINYRRNVGALFNFAVKKEYCSRNPITNIPVPRMEWKPPCVLTVDEATDLIKTAYETHHSTSGKRSGLGLLPYVALGLFAGIRSRELLQLKWTDIKLDRNLVTISARIAKGRQMRNIDLTDNCVQWLRLVERKTGNISPLAFSKRFKALTLKAGFPDWRESRSNAMRHSFGTYCFAKSQNANETAAQMGHRGGDAILFQHYRSLATKEDGRKYFEITPESIDGKLVAFPNVAG